MPQDGYAQLAASETEEDRAFHRAMRRRRRDLTLDDVYGVLEESERPEDHAYAAALRQRGEGPSTAMRWAVDADRRRFERDADEEFVRNATQRLERYRELLAEMEQDGATLDHAVLNELAGMGHRADGLIADYYDNLTLEEIEAEFSGSEPVKVHTPPDGIRSSFSVTFRSHELAELLRRVGNERVSVYLRKAALNYQPE